MKYFLIVFSYLISLRLTSSKINIFWIQKYIKQKFMYNRIPIFSLTC